MVGLHRARDVGVAESFADDLHRDPVLDEHAAVGMPEIMKADRGHAGVVHGPAERLVHGVRVDRFAVAVGEHPRLVVGDADRRELGGLKRPPTGEDGEGRVVEGACPAGVSGLAAGLVDLVADGDEPTVEVKALLGEVDVGS